jgi:hypothetical protein
MTPDELTGVTTSPVGETAAAPGPPSVAVGDDSELVAGYVSLWHSVTAIGRSGMAYSNPRLLWWPLAYLELPLLWTVNALSIAHRPNELVTLGRASAQLGDRERRILASKPPAVARLLWVLLIVGFVLLLTGPLWIARGTSSSAALVVAALWLLVLVIAPMLSYGVPALIQQYRGRGLPQWKEATLAETGRAPVVVSQLAAWPCAGGGRTGTGDGFTLIRALAAEARRNDRILVGVARSRNLPERYIADTGAEASPQSPRHLRWP